MKKIKKKDRALELLLEEDGPTISAPEIIWPCFEMNYEGEYGDGDKDVFSGWDNVIQNYIIQENLKDINGIVLGSKKFWDCFAKSIEITFVDNFFDEYTYNKMWHELERVSTRYDNTSKNIVICSSIKFIKNIYDWQQEKKKNKQGLYNHHVFTLIDLDTMQCGDKEKNIIHDRFAIMDGDIWHCGANIGGVHPCINAMTHGWEDKNNELRDFFRKGTKYG